MCLQDVDSQPLPFDDELLVNAPEPAASVRVRFGDPVARAAVLCDERVRLSRVVRPLVGGSRSEIRCYSELTYYSSSI